MVELTQREFNEALTSARKYSLFRDKVTIFLPLPRLVLTAGCMVEPLKDVRPRTLSFIWNGQNFQPDEPYTIIAENSDG